MTTVLWFAIAALALLLSSILATLQFALHDLSRGRLEELAEKSGSARRSAQAHAIAADVEGHLTAVALPRVLVSLGFLIGSVMWVTSLRGATEPGLTELAIGVGAAAVALWFGAIVIGHSVAEHAGERAVFGATGFLRACSVALFPARGLIGLVDEVIKRLAGPAEQTAAEQLEQELLDVVEEHGLGEDIGEEERDMLESIVEFRTTTVEQTMTPRTDIQALEYTDDLEAVKVLVDDRGHSRIPVYEDGLDNIVGLLYAKDLLRWIINHGSNGKPFVLREILRPAIFVPETKTVRELLTELLAQQVHIAMVADEYGGTAGLITIEDIIEEIFGEITDEYEEPEAARPGVELDEANRAAEIDAKTAIDDANDLTEAVRIELPESDEYDTVGGFVVFALGRIPAAGESFVHETDDASLTVEVLEAQPTRVSRVRVTRRDPEPATAHEAEREAG